MLNIYSSNNGQHFRQGELFPCDRPIIFHSAVEEARIEMHVSLEDLPFETTITITPMDEDGSMNLNVSHRTNLSGTVTPYGFDGLASYAVWTKAFVELIPPPGHSTMMSFPHFHLKWDAVCSSYRLVLFDRSDGFKTLWRRCGSLQLSPEVYPYKTSPLRVLFNIQSMKEYSAFKLRFSFHGASERPEKQLTNESTIDLFNCTVPFYDKFRQHFSCNLEPECVYAEDEINCPYVRGSCHPGFLNAGSKCYKYVKTRKVMTWYDASVLCLDQGLTLASMPTLKQLDAFRDDILRFVPTAFKVFIGLQTSDPSLPATYRETWQWSSGTIAYYVHLEEKVFKPTCVSLAALFRDVSPTMCGFYEYMHYIFCVSDNTHTTPNETHQTSLPALEVGPTFGMNESARFITCSEGHVMHDFLSCDHGSRCGAELGAKSCVVSSSGNAWDNVEGRLEIVMYVCDSRSQTIHYTQVCDHQAQCFDSSDESFCIHRACAEKRCLNGQCVQASLWCDGMAHCADGSDETCYQFVSRSVTSSSCSKPEFNKVLFDGHGKYRNVPECSAFPVCPPTHFLCADLQLCLPVYLRCNGVYDCPEQEDERTCDDVTCPGYYRCRGSAVCLHSDHVCDGVFQCPQQDDELLCRTPCPDDCTCQGLAFTCPRPFPVQAHSDLRYLDSSQSGLTPDTLFHLHYLIRLSLESCRLFDLPVLDFPNLKFLDLGKNKLTDIGMHVLLKLSNLNFVSLSGNPLTKILAPKSNTLLEKVHTLDLSHTRLRYFDSETLFNVRYVKCLNLSHGMLQVIDNNGFRFLTQVETLDLRGTELQDYPVEMLQSLSSLREMYSDVYKLCCRDVLPSQLLSQNCHASSDDISSCEDLLRSDVYRMFLWITCSVALIGNVGSFCSRIYMQRGKPQNSFNVFITHLHVSDFFMGLYLVMVGSADQIYRGTYLWHDKAWKTGQTCKVAGFFSLLSCEMSTFVICFITLDRFIVMRFPFSQLRFGNRSAHVTCALSWVFGVTLAALPLLPVTTHWEFYSQTEICIPLPVTRRSFKGRMYSFGILIVLNFVLFLFIAVGQLFIYVSIQSNSIAMDQKNAREATVARRLLTVVMSDFLCWFPIGLMGLMASNGVSIPGEVNVAMAIFALPLNSALNPFLYTFNLVTEKRKKASEQRLLKLLQLRSAAV